ncbi:hypothetical protein AAE478_002362 [Parahypoxylon ruwenzoriense]
MRHRTSSKLAGDGTYPDLQTARLNAVALGSTVDYHNSLLDQHRQEQHESARPRPPHSHQCRPNPNPNPNLSRASLRHWLPLSNTRKPGATVDSGDDATTTTTTTATTKRSKKTKEEKDQQNRELRPSLHPAHLTRKDLEEFEALPIAIRRKYFSTLERLRFAQTSDILDHPHDPDHDPCQRHIVRRTPLKASSLGRPSERPLTAPSCRGHAVSVSADFAFLAKLPAKIREKHLSREEQVIVAKQLRQSVILDAADEAILKIGRQASRRFSPPPHYPPTLSSSARPSMDSLLTENAGAETHDFLYDSFRWLDEDEELDLSLTLDDYHVNLRDSVPVPPKDPWAPAFRRHLSFSKIPFGRTSMSSSRPATKDAARPTTGLSSPSAVVYPQNGRRKSRAFSLITPKHTVHDSISSIDPGAAHYQDPEARLKLRVYLASPQKFDEAIEFGFPSNDVPSASPYRDLPSTHGYSRGPLSVDSEEFKTFLADDQSSTCSEDASTPDPESPRTPQTVEKHARPLQLSNADGYHSSRLPDGYAQAPAASREMTLRMTLTRPDLRACEDQIYGWQRGSHQYSRRPSQVLALRDDVPTSTTSYTKDGTKESIDRIFADIDQEFGPPPTDNNVMKRIWNRVRRG